jgi:O-antigen/teichoic acid export membrane protein
MTEPRLLDRLLSNAATTYLRLAATFAVGLFTTWYVLGAVGSVGFGLIALSFASTGLSHSVDRGLRQGMVRELADAISRGQPGLVQRSVSSALRLCLQVALPLAGLVAVLAAVAALGAFETPEDIPGLPRALSALIVAEGIHALARLLTAPMVQTLYASQRVALDNVLMVVARLTYALSAILVFGWWLNGRDLATQLIGFAVARASLQLFDVALGVHWARRLHPELTWRLDAWDLEEYRSIRGTVWHFSQVNVLLNVAPLALALLINLFFGLTYNTLWQIVVQFTGYVWVIAEGLLRGLAPLTTHLQRQGRIESAVDLLLRSIRYQWTIVLPTTLGLGLFVEPLLRLWLGSRLAADPALRAAGMDIDQAFRLTATMCLLLLVSRALRAGFFGVETTLYGLGEVRSFSWFAKWSLGLALALASLIFAGLDEPLGAPLALLVSGVLFSPIVVIRAARRTLGLGYSELLVIPLAGPLAASAAMLPLLLVARSTPASLAFAGWLASAVVLYAVLAWWWVLRSGERKRFREALDVWTRRLR